MRLIYGLKGIIYYIDESEEACYYLKQLTDLDDTVYAYLMETFHRSGEPKLYMRSMTEMILPVLADEMNLEKDWTYRNLYLTMLEATAKICKVPKYKIYTLEEL